MIQTNDTNFLKKKLSESTMRQEILESLPLNLREIIMNIPIILAADVEEIRLRINRPLMIYANNEDIHLDLKGEIVKDKNKSYMVTATDISKAFQLITDYSIYALEEELRNGFVTIKGGHRVGISGRVVLNGNKIKTIKDISGLNIRISKQKLGISDELMHFILTSTKNFMSTLIISPPQSGKTTLLRDIIRNLSNGMKNPYFNGFKVSVVDERSEIAGCFQGVPQNDIGYRTDVLDACPKAEGIMMLIRSMSPQIIGTDEIGKKEDMEAVEEALNAGIKVVTTAHGKDLEEVTRRPTLNQLLKQRIFERIVILTNQPRVGTIHSIIDGSSSNTIYTNVLGRREGIC